MKTITLDGTEYMALDDVNAMLTELQVKSDKVEEDGANAKHVVVVTQGSLIFTGCRAADQEANSVLLTDACLLRCMPENEYGISGLVKADLVADYPLDPVGCALIPEGAVLAVLRADW